MHLYKSIPFLLSTEIGWPRRRDRQQKPNSSSMRCKAGIQLKTHKCCICPIIELHRICKRKTWSEMWRLINVGEFVSKAQMHKLALFISHPLYWITVSMLVLKTCVLEKLLTPTLPCSVLLNLAKLSAKSRGAFPALLTKQLSCVQYCNTKYM